MKNMLIGQSGGPTVAINASLAGAARYAAQCPEIGRIYGARYGIEGLLKGRVVDIRAQLQSEADYRALECTPSMALGSCRYKLPEFARESDVYYKLLSILRGLNVGYFFYIGGNDSMDTVQKLSAFFRAVGEDIRVVGIPKTIDNDLAETDHSPGFGSAAKFIATSAREIVRDADVYDLTSVTVIEVMGRDAGWLTASAALARQNDPDAARPGAPHLIYLPETPFEVRRFVEDVRALHASGVQGVVVAASEGLRAPDGSYAADAVHAGGEDMFGHRSSLSGVGRWLAGVAGEQLGCKARAVELSVLQRAAAHLLSATDLSEAGRVGAHAVKLALQGESGTVAVLRRVSDEPYRVQTASAPVESMANIEHRVPQAWITPSGNDVTQEMVRYLRPLILGEVEVPMESGLPRYFTFSD